MIRCNFNDLKVFRNNLGKLTNTEYDRLAEECCNEIAARLLRMTKQNTPVDTGHLKRSWKKEAARKNGNVWCSVVYNTADYAMYVEYGHRTTNHKGWVTGRFMLTNAEKEIERIVPQLLEKRLLQKLGELFD